MLQQQAKGVLALGGAALLGAVLVLREWPGWAELGQWGRSHAAALALIAVSLVCVAVAARLWLRSWGVLSSRRPVLSWWMVAGAAVVVALVAWGATSWLLGEAAVAKDVGAARVDAIKTGLGIGAGTTGIFALLPAVRRQQHTEIDATEKNLTELYTKAADQLGSDKAAVRLAGLYALERLAHGNPLQRQSIVNVICAYLRMPYDLPEDEQGRGGSRNVARHAEQRERSEEREVRLAAQRILADHLRWSNHEAFWADIDLDLTNAHLIDFELALRDLGNARFDGVKFTGVARFGGTTFNGVATFSGATFTDNAQFDGATFTKYASFHHATFDGITGFRDVTFTDDAEFGRATFTGDARFDGATQKGVSFAVPTSAQKPRT